MVPAHLYKPGKAFFQVFGPHLRVDKQILLGSKVIPGAENVYFPLCRIEDPISVL